MSSSETYIFTGEWNPNTVYDNNLPAGYQDEVEYEGAIWIANWYNEDQNPMEYSEPPGQTTNPNSPGEPGYTWSLAPGNQVNFNTVVPSWAQPEQLENGVVTPIPILGAGYTSSSSVALFWQPAEVLGVGDVNSYDVYVTNDKTHVTSLAGTTTSTSLTVSGLSASTKYTFTVDANDLTGTSGDQSQTGTSSGSNPYTWNENPGAGPNPTVTVATAAPQTSSGKYFSPYLDMTLPTTDLASISENSGLRSFTLAFMQTTEDANGNVVLNNGAPSISWGGLGTRTTESTGTIIQEVKEVEAEGGVVTISIGGYNGLDAAVYAAENHLTAAQLQAEYQEVITTYGVNSLDFDIENAATVDNYAANKLRDEAIAGLEADNPGLQVSFTLATTAKGLGSLPAGEADNAANDATAANDGISNDYGVLQQAVKDGVTLSTVNIMAMDYYDGNTKEEAPNGTGVNAMYTNAVTAADGTEKQLTKLGIASTTQIGITPMIGQNDDTGGSGTDGVDEVFTLADAKKLEAFAASTSWVAGVGEWELPRDSAESTNNLGVAPSSTSSGVVQTAYEFAHDLDAIETTGTTGGPNMAIDAAVAGEPNQNFVFTPNFGQQTLADFDQNFVGAGHDTITLPKSEFANFATLLHDTTYNSAGATITDPVDGDQLSLLNFTRNMLVAAKADFKFA